MNTAGDFRFYAAVYLDDLLATHAPEDTGRIAVDELAKAVKLAVERIPDDQRRSACKATVDRVDRLRLAYANAIHGENEAKRLERIRRACSEVVL